MESAPHAHGRDERAGRPTGLVAILRGLPTEDAAEVGRTLYDAGFRTLEVPLNSPEPLASIRVLRSVLPSDATVGAGTVLTVTDVHAAHEAGSQIIVSPNTNTDVIRTTRSLGMLSYPGVATASEAFAAVEAGALAVKLFPSGQVGTGGLRAWTAVMPREIEFIPVGGIDTDSIGEWVRAGATGFGIGTSLYAPGRELAQIRQVARELIQAWDGAAAQLRKLV
ncbi:2-dehydro-3-deoxy-6-phosphogalactonate aldolase [Nocardiopsis ansamitocini]|uniref:2-dehydro-3-deoxy-6-phosphogalactonate aldolase n=1 Tax=Nocardiopsis ansamitocini TaxID=1670832 RepID=A0A9W6P9T1_9ACTN|nr:2-dehydro-3-deoxy-6-phosphogalactonate aldolase [Nocardiopsis ansamitocini]GLU50275.1 2-dehydro-3-deoxy-6-phosphogalactonate aldolase [Nocardiopsis ansamitocini]